MLKLLQPDFPEIDQWQGYLAAAYALGHFSNFSPNVEKFEAEIASYLKTDRSVVSVSSATNGLLVSLLALGVKGNVLVPAFTFPATASAVYQAGCTPIPVDVCPDLWEMGADDIVKAASKMDVAAIIHVRPFGFRRDIQSILDVGKKLNAPVIVDAAAGFGSVDRDQTPFGKSIMPDAEVFSFHATKPLAIGEGGCVVAAPELAPEIRAMSNFSFGAEAKGYRWGTNSKLSDVSAAIGRAALTNLNGVIEYRSQQAASWRSLLTGISGIDLPKNEGNPAWQLFPIRVSGRDAFGLMQHLEDHEFQSRVYYQPTINAYDNPGQTPVSETLSKEMISLPIGRHVREQHRRSIADCIKEWIG